MLFGRRTLFQALLGWGAAKATPLPSATLAERGVRGLVHHAVYCPTCGWAQSPAIAMPEIYDEQDMPTRLARLKQTQQITCQNGRCGQRFHARFATEI
jgi:hypothetical protein